jgi:hypothetical protein
MAKFFGNAKEDDTRPAKRQKLDAGDVLSEKPIYIVSDESEDEAVASTKRAVTATPEKSRTQTLPEVEVAPRASSHEPMGSQDAFVATADRPFVKRKREDHVKPAPESSKGKRKASDTIGDGNELVQGSSKRSNEQHVCPICSKTLQTDNAGLNAHVDWCLSRSAILEASASGSPNATQQVTKGGGSKKSVLSNTGLKPGSSKGSGKGGKQDIRLAWKIA